MKVTLKTLISMVLLGQTVGAWAILLEKRNKYTFLIDGESKIFKTNGDINMYKEAIDKIEEELEYPKDETEEERVTKNTQILNMLGRVIH